MILPDKKLVRKVPKLQTKRLLLRPFTLKDAKAATKRGWFDRRNSTAIDTLDKAKKFLKERILHQPNGYYLAVILKETGELIGDLKLCHFSWFADLGGELCYGFAKKHWGKGYATEASMCFVDYLFKTVKLHKISGDTDPDNFASQKVLYKLGFKIEGVAKEQHLDRQKKIWKDEYNWGLLRDEWLKKHKKKLYQLA